MTNEEHERLYREHLEYQNQIDQRRKELAWALISRPLTQEEMEEVKSMGHHVFISSGVPFREEAIIERFYKAMVAQFEIKTIAGREGKP